MFSSFICPKCREKLTRIENSLVCPSRHTYDIAREGYVNLEPHRCDSGDDRGMCISRCQFLSGGYYQNLADTIIRLAALKNGENLIDLGCGEGWYLRAFAQKHPNSGFCGIDLSKTAVKMAAKAEKQAGRKNIDYAVAGIFSLPSTLTSHTRFEARTVNKAEVTVATAKVFLYLIRLKAP